MRVVVVSVRVVTAVVVSHSVLSVWVVTAVVVSHSVCGCCFSLGRVVVSQCVWLLFQSGS